MRPEPAIESLRAQIERIEGKSRRAKSVLPFGIADVDSRLPGGGLARGALHEVAGGGNGAVDGAAAALFSAGIWAIKALRDEPLPLFAAASTREAEIVPELNEPTFELRPMTAGSEVVEDYSHVGLTLRAHPLSFLREDLQRRRIVTCAEAMATRDGRWLEAAGIVLVRQRPGSAKGVMFITLEDETGIANLVVWAKVFEANHRAVLSASMMAVRGRIQREGDVVHLVAQRITDLSADLASVGSRDAKFPLPHGRGDQVRNGGSGPDPRELPSKGLRTRDIYIPDLHIDTIKVHSRNFH